MGMQLQEKVAVITGAGRGIGRAIALRFAREGAHVVLNARREADIAAVARTCRENGTRTLAIPGDASLEADVQLLAQATLAEFGRIDILVNNVGVGNYKNLVDTTPEEYDTMMDTNMRSTFLVTRAFVPTMIEQKQGSILIVSSMAGKRGYPGEAVYCATKFAQVGFAQALDGELRPHGIKVGTLCPGGVKTDFAFGLGRTEGDPALDRMLDADDVAQAAVFMAVQSPKSRIITVEMRTMNEAF